MNQQDVFKRVNLVDGIKSFDGGLKNALILIGMLAALLVILITAVSIQKSTNLATVAAAVPASETAYANPELNVVANYAGRREAGTAPTNFHTNPELKGLATSVSNGRSILAMNPELKVVQAYAGDGRDSLATNPEVGTFLRYQD